MRGIYVCEIADTSGISIGSACWRRDRGRSPQRESGDKSDTTATSLASPHPETKGSLGLK